MKIGITQGPDRDLAVAGFLIAGIMIVAALALVLV